VRLLCGKELNLQYVSGQSLSLEVNLSWAWAATWVAAYEDGLIKCLAVRFRVTLTWCEILNRIARSLVGIWCAIVCVHAWFEKICWKRLGPSLKEDPHSGDETWKWDLDGGVQFMTRCRSPVLILRSAYASVSEKEHNTGKKTSVLGTGSSFTCPTMPLCDILLFLIWRSVIMAGSAA